ncbi:MAG: diphosphomevalonate decarboxylase [Prolixibacteraceae bacterium]|jgi:diphosphomevalonate decarboxylase|nr:diphosphomevalonate decarboxylase [Prolixibacteraceae bacterium]
MKTNSNIIQWQSPSNIALIKYWGKHGMQLPNNASLSMTLKNARTTTEMRFLPSAEGMEVNYYFEGERNQLFEEKVILYFEKIKVELPFVDDYIFEIHSSNSFPHSTGIASSASSMSALALCLLSVEEIINKKKYEKGEFFSRASHLARLGSGSASRSVYGGWTTWGSIEDYENTSNERASTLGFDVHPKFEKMGDAVLLVSSKTKSVSSSLGHNLMKIHPFANARYEQATDNIHALMCSMQVGDFDTFASIVENEALTLHSLLMTSSPDGMLFRSGSLEIIEAVRSFRATTKTELCFTLDAGPNVHLIYPLEEKERVHRFIRNELIQFCENGKWIDDEMGGGPMQI